MFIGLQLYFNGFGQTDYPEIYKELNLPIYSNAVLQETSRKTDNLNDGIKLFLESNDDYTSLRNFYESKMESNGWELRESIAVKKMRELGKLGEIPFSGEWIKDDLRFQLFSTRSKNKTKITITLLRL